MKRVGILSHYYDTTNYGGALQAYALCQAIDQLGHKSQQIAVDCFAECNSIMREQSLLKSVLRRIRPLYSALYAIKNRKRRRIGRELKEKLRVSFSEFNNTIPHSEQVYNKKDIVKTIDDYDAFVVGSDQVWNPMWHYEPFFLTFVPSSLPKISYAASISQKILPEKAKVLYKEYLEDFTAVSVRERNAVDLLADISPKKVEYVLDPTLLLGAECWGSVASNRMVKERYVFCYFLGARSDIRSIAKEYAKSHGLTLVNVKHATGQYHQTDEGFGDLVMDAPSPREFLSLIKYADCVFTDSFHAVVFSHIFKREYVVFNRDQQESMNSRIIDITRLFGTEERFCSCKECENVEYIQSLKAIDYTTENVVLDNLKRKSMAFLRENLS